MHTDPFNTHARTGKPLSTGNHKRPNVAFYFALGFIVTAGLAALLWTAGQ